MFLDPAPSYLNLPTKRYFFLNSKFNFMRNLMMCFCFLLFCFSCRKTELSEETFSPRDGKEFSTPYDFPQMKTNTEPPTSGDVCLTSLDIMIPEFRGVVFPIRRVLLNDGSIVGWNDDYKVNFMKFSLSYPGRISILNRNHVANLYWEINCQVNDQPHKIRYDLKAYRCDYTALSTLPTAPIIRRPIPIFPIGVFPVFPLVPVREPENLQLVYFNLFSSLRYQFEAEMPFDLGNGMTGKYVVGLFP